MIGLMRLNIELQKGIFIIIAILKDNIMRSNITILFMIINLFVYSQNPQGDYATNKYSIIPPAPEVANLSNFSDISVSPFTGQPQIEIPIYTLKEGSLSVPITLSYRGGGIKQNEQSGISHTFYKIFNERLPGGGMC